MRVLGPRLFLVLAMVVLAVGCSDDDDSEPADEPDASMSAQIDAGPTGLILTLNVAQDSAEPVSASVTIGTEVQLDCATLGCTYEVPFGAVVTLQAQPENLFLGWAATTGCNPDGVLDESPLDFVPSQDCTINPLFD